MLNLKRVNTCVEIDKAVIINGKIKAEITKFGNATFFKEDRIILNEYIELLNLSRNTAPV